jgi:hypothetical protein
MYGCRTKKTANICSPYVCIVDTGEREFAERVGALIMQSEVVQDVLQPALKTLDPVLQRTYFNIDSYDPNSKNSMSRAKRDSPR